MQSKENLQTNTNNAKTSSTIKQYQMKSFHHQIDYSSVVWVVDIFRLNPS
jgi:hypothetical protein